MWLEIGDALGGGHLFAYGYLLGEEGVISNYHILMNLLLQLVLCRVAAVKVSLYIIHSADYIFLFSFWSFEISEGILRNQKIIIGLDPFSSQRFNIFGSVWIFLVFVSNMVLKDAKLQ